jgi:hypothetical protein
MKFYNLIEEIIKNFIRKMGNNPTIDKFYSNSDIKIENHIREFELDIGFFRYDFNFIFSKLFIEVIDNNEKFDFSKINYYTDNSVKIDKNKCEIKKLNSILLEFYPLQIIKFLDRSFFKSSDYKYYDIKKLQCFIFLISNDSKTKDLDSGIYFINRVN